MRHAIVALIIFALAGALCAQFTYLKTLDGTGPQRMDYRTPYNFSRPVGLEYKDGMLYVSDFDKAFVYVLDVGNNTVVNRAGVPGDDPTSLQGPMHISFYPGDGLYIADRAAGMIKLYTGTITLLAVGGGTGSLNMPTSVSSDSGFIYITETGSNTIRKINRVYYTLNSTFSSLGTSDGQLDAPEDLQVSGGRIYIANTKNDRVEILGTNFSYIQTVGRGLGGVSLKGPRGIYYDAPSGLLYVADTDNHRVVVFNSRGYPLATIGTAGQSGDGNYTFNQPYDVLVADGKLFVSDYGNRRVQVYSIGEFTVDAGVLGRVNAANQTVAELVSLIPVANRLGIEVTTTAPLDMEAAYEALDRRDYGEAESRAQKAAADADSKLLFAKQEIAVGAKGLASKALEQIAPYEAETANTSLAADYTSIKNKVADVSGKIERQEYAAATDLALSLDSLANVLVQKVMLQRAGTQVAQGHDVADSLRAREKDISTRLSDFLAKSDKFKQAQTGESVSGLLQYAQDDIDGGKLSAANDSLNEAERRLGSLSADLDAKAAKITAAQDKISSAKTRIAELEAQKVILYPDFTSARSLLRDADNSVYDRPDSASSMAEEALTLAGQASSNSKTLSYVIIGAVILFGLALIAGGFLAWKLFLTPRKK